MLGVKCHLYTEADQQERIQISSFFIFTVIFFTVYLGCSILKYFVQQGKKSFQHS